VRDYFEAPWNAYFTGTITKLPATNAGVWEVTFSDGNKLDYDTEPEIRQVLDVTKMEQWQPLVTKLKGGFTYLENRLTNNCDSPYHLKVQHEATKLLRAFDPSLASGLVDTNYVDVIRYMCTACAWEASGAVSGKFREISAPAAPLANFSLHFAKLLQTPRIRSVQFSSVRSSGRLCTLFLFPNPLSLLFSSISICDELEC
jgi:hypothetical protein